MKNLKYILIAVIVMFIGIGGVSAKSISKQCEYNFYDNLSGGNSELILYIYDDGTISGSVKKWNNVSFPLTSATTINQSEISTNIANNICPNYSALKVDMNDDSKSFMTFSNNKDNLLDYLKSNDLLDNTHIATSTEYNGNPQVSEQYYNQMMTESENILKTTESFDISECKDESKDITAYAKCNDQYDRLKIRINNFELNLNTYISQNYISEDDQRTKTMRENIKNAELNLVNFKYAIDNKQEIVTPEYNQGCEIFGDTLVDLIREVYGYFKWIIPILIVILSMLDFVKVVGTGKDDDFKKAQNNLIKRIIVGVVFFLIPTLISMIINLSGITEQFENGNSIIEAVTCILK